MDYSNTGQGTSTFNQFTGNNTYVNSTLDFMNSNSLVAQVAFALVDLEIVTEPSDDGS